MDYHIREGKVGVLISHGFGAGWSTWADDDKHRRTMLFDGVMVAAVERGDIDAAVERACEVCPGEYTGGSKGLRVHYLDPGDHFRVHEHDGAESIVLLDSDPDIHTVPEVP